MTHKPVIAKIYTELETSSQLPKCQKCGCMAETLKYLADLLPTLTPANTTDEAELKDVQNLAQYVTVWTEQMKPVRYTCLGCEPCHPAVAQNAFSLAFPDIDASPALSCDFQDNQAGWPPVVGEYFVLDHTAPVAVSTLASLHLAEVLAGQKPPGLAIVGKTETENIGLDKVIKNVIANPALRYLILAGQDPKGHQPGRTLLALAENGLDTTGHVIGSPGKRPILRNVSAAEIAIFREKIDLIDMIGCDHPDEIKTRIMTLAANAPAACGCCSGDEHPVVASAPPTVVTVTETNQAVTMDKAGYFVIVPLADKNIIHIEHYGYDNTLLHAIEGSTARDLYITIIANGWLAELSHAAYLGKELAKAELSIQYGFKYIQDGA